MIRRLRFPNGISNMLTNDCSVQAHTSGGATDDTAGWQELAPQLNTQPMQIDLFSAASNTCLLTNLGSNSALPAGSYQQIRLILVPNDGSGGATPGSNACGDQGWNCAVLHDGSIHELQLSSQANTGIKIPPGQVVGGPIVVAAGQDVDLNIDFNACASILRQGNGQYRLKPVLTAGQVSTNTTGISGKIVDSLTGPPVVGGRCRWHWKKRIRQERCGLSADTADSSGLFNFCPLPAGSTFDVLAVGINVSEWPTTRAWSPEYRAERIWGDHADSKAVPPTCGNIARSGDCGERRKRRIIDAAVTAQQTVA